MIEETRNQEVLEIRNFCIICAALIFQFYQISALFGFVSLLNVDESFNKKACKDKLNFKGERKLKNHLLFDDNSTTN